jgi:ATP-dependent exoDNAse (exonuclease V) beta subunit
VSGRLLSFRRDDELARERIAGELDRSFLVEAAAGTGKTTVLVERLVNLIATGTTTIDRVAALTFTHKAAGEMKLRLRQRLDARRAAAEVEPAVAERLTAAIARLEEARIGTIHSFCGELLRERPVEAGVDPGFQPLDEEEARALYARAFQAWIERRLDQDGGALRRALTRLAVRNDPQGRTAIEQLREAGEALRDWRDFPAGWRRERFDREAAVDAMVGDLARLAGWRRRCTDPGDLLFQDLLPVETLCTWIERSEAIARRRDHDALEARLRLLASELRKKRRKGRGHRFAEGVEREAVLAERDRFLAALDDFTTRADADLAAALRDELAAVVDGYEEGKRRAGRLDFLDLVLRTRDLLRDAPAVRRTFQERFTHLLVDELQDTDPLQMEILLLLAADDAEQSDWRRTRPLPGKLFLVGDPKQSIYRFRRADVLLYQEVQAQLAAGGVEVLHLRRNFRAVRGLQQAVNHAFAPLMTGDRVAGQPEYVALAEHRANPVEQPYLVALPPPPSLPGDRVSYQAVEAQTPDAVAAFLAWLLADSGWTVGEGGDPERRVPVAPGHVCLLFRRFLSWGEDAARPYADALERRGIAHVLVGTRSFHQREEVETLRMALNAVEWPDDELAVFATLRGALFAVSDEALLRWRVEHGRLHPFRPLPAPPAPELQPIADGLALLAELHRRRHREPAAFTLGRLLRQVRAHAGFALRPAGQQVLANVARVVDLARRFEMGGGSSFRAFVERLNEEAGEAGSTPAPTEDGADAVRLMTVHAAKGLEFPVVVLADPTARLASDKPQRTLDPSRGLCAIPLLGCVPWDLRDAEELELRRDQAEGVRVAYVAATRARDLLVVTCASDRGADGRWLAPLARALHPERGGSRGEPAPGCPPPRAAAPDELPPAVAPGLHRFPGSAHTAVWWDLARLDLGREGERGVRRSSLLADGAPEAHAAGAARHARWRAAHDATCAAGAEPALRVHRATETPWDPTATHPVRVEDLPRRAGRPRGARFGSLVHGALRDVELAGEGSGGSAPGAVRAVVELHGRMLQASQEEREAALEAVQAALGHPLLRRAAVAARCHREVPFSLAVREHELVEGVVDLAFRDPDGAWTVVDFKTDEELDGDALARYQRQVAWYLEALARGTGERGSGVLLRV